MKNIYLAPNGKYWDPLNFKRTVLGSVSYDSIEQFLNPKEKEMLKKYKFLKMWGIKDIKKNDSVHRKIKQNDLILFYEDGNFCYCTEVIMTKRDDYIKTEDGKYIMSEECWKLAEKLWGNGEYANLMFLDNLKEIKIPVYVIRELAGFSPNWFCGTFTPLYHNGRAVKKIIEEFDSIENFIEKYSIMNIKQDDHAEIKRETVQDNFINTDKLLHAIKKFWSWLLSFFNKSQKNWLFFNLGSPLPLPPSRPQDMSLAIKEERVTGHSRDRVRCYRYYSELLVELVNGIIERSFPVGNTAYISRDEYVKYHIEQRPNTNPKSYYNGPIHRELKNQQYFTKRGVVFKQEVVSALNSEYGYRAGDVLFKIQRIS